MGIGSTVTFKDSVTLIFLLKVFRNNIEVKMRKLISAILILCLCLGIYSCSNNSDEDGLKESTTTDNDTTDNDTTDNDTTDNDTTDNDTTTDTTAATLAEVTAVTTPTNDTTPDYTFSSSEAGTITYGGSCSSSTTSATTGDNTITLVSLSEGTYSNCTVIVTDSAGNASSSLTMNSFVVDTTAPTVSSTSPSDSASSVSIGSTISVTFSESIDNSSVTANTSNTTCSESMQLSSNNFSSCIQMSSTPSASNINKTFSVTPSEYLSSKTTYKIRVTTLVKDLVGNSMINSYTTSNGFTSADITCVDSNIMCLTLTWTDGIDPDLHSYYFPDWTYEEEKTSGFDNTSRGTRYWVYGDAANKKYSETGQTIQPIDGFSPTDNETQVWATDSGKVGNGTYLVYLEDSGDPDVQNFKIVLSGPGLSNNLIYGPYDFKDDDNNSTTEALNPQAVFFIQVDNNSIVRSDNVSVGDNLSSTLMQWTGELQNSVVD